MLRILVFATPVYFLHPSVIISCSIPIDIYLVERNKVLSMTFGKK